MAWIENIQQRNGQEVPLDGNDAIILGKVINPLHSLNSGDDSTEKSWASDTSGIMMGLVPPLKSITRAHRDASAEDEAPSDRVSIGFSVSEDESSCGIDHPVEEYAEERVPAQLGLSDGNGELRESVWVFDLSLVSNLSSSKRNRKKGKMKGKREDKKKTRAVFSTEKPTVERRGLGTASALLMNVHVHVIANQYDTLPLKSAAEDKFKRNSDHDEWNEAVFPRAIWEGYMTTPETDRPEASRHGGTSSGEILRSTLGQSGGFKMS
ncbi:hypothetical protein LTR50_005685 [Elasticomyces elasticus]|nr:hypothetical protein LTR50_005685 [Elasticomyces elasticus]